MLRVPLRLVAVALVGFALGACAAEIEPFTAPPDESYPAEQVDQGRGVYLRSCASCHGREGGGGTGPNIRQVWERLSYDQHIEVVETGRNGMPAFGRTLSPDDIAAVVAYQRFGWSDPSN